jgi:uncharacterized protein YndB with AHSA1/START domain
MRLDLSFQEHFPQPIEQVWQALTNPGMLARWLMENDFEPRVGKQFTMRNPVPGYRGWIECEVLELEAPHRMAWSWSMGDEEAGPSRVTFELRSESGGTLLRVWHTGTLSDSDGEMVRDRWPIKVAAIAELLRDGTPFSIVDPTKDKHPGSGRNT